MFINDWAKTTRDGKPGISVYQHCLTVRYVVEELLRHYPHFCDDNAIDADAIAFLAAAHDVGKISFDFLQKCSAWIQQEGLEEKARKGLWKTLYTRWHPDISQQSLQLFLQEHKHNLIDAYFWGAVVGAHHGQVLTSSSPRPYKPSNDGLEEKRQTFLLKFWHECGCPTLPSIDDGNDPRLWAAAGMITLADWIGSDDTFFPVDHELSEDKVASIAARAIHSIGLSIPKVTRNLTFQDIFNGNTPYPMQIDCADVITAPGIYILEAPMGMGKTEAALWATYQMLQKGAAQGVFFALPTQATSNRMFLRLEAFAQKICPGTTKTQLIHGNSWLCEDLTALNIPNSPDEFIIYGSTNTPDGLWFNSTRRALFAPFGVGTVDQALLSVLAVKHFPLRRFALSRKVVIIDEVHSYDVYTGTLIRHLCEELEKLHSTVIILSATLTEEVRCNLLGMSRECEDTDAPYPRIT